MKHTDFNQMPREDLLVELKCWRNKFDEKLQEELEKYDDEINDLSEKVANEIKKIAYEFLDSYDGSCYNFRSKVWQMFRFKTRKKLSWGICYHIKSLKDELIKEGLLK